MRTAYDHTVRIPSVGVSFNCPADLRGAVLDRSLAYGVSMSKVLVALLQKGLEAEKAAAAAAPIKPRTRKPASKG